MYSEYCQTIIMERFAKIVNGYQALNIFAKSSILDVLEISENVCGMYSNAKSEAVDLKCSTE